MAEQLNTEKWTLGLFEGPHTRREPTQLAAEWLARNDSPARSVATDASNARRVAHARMPGGEALRRCGAVAAAAVVLIAALAAPLAATQRSTAMWGTGLKGASATTQFLASSAMHVNNGIAAGQVNAALDGVLYQGTSISITSVGSQNVVNTTVYGDENRVRVKADQNSSNSGNVSNDGTINVQRGALKE